MRTFFVLVSLLLLTACTGEKSERYSIAPPSADVKIKTSARTISVSKISLPSYAKESGIFIQNAQGSIVPLPKADWADDTERAMRLFLVRNLSDLSGAEVASDPWPLGGVPEAEVRVDVEQMLVDNSNTMRLSGQFSIRRDEATSRSRIEQFDITTRVGSQTPQDVVKAHSLAWQELAKAIANGI